MSDLRDDDTAVEVEVDGDFHECLSWQLDYLSGGRSRKVLINWLTARPQDAKLIIHDVLQFLQTSRKFLEKDRNPLGELQKEEIYKMYMTGDFMGFGKIEGWDALASKQKVYEISKTFPEYRDKESRIWNIIGEQKAKDSEE
jgi:hypothetical protein|tara:strand:- start:208 stop:633 length:426 start_codon:yes stop_codon:yes gene_type:complete